MNFEPYKRKLVSVMDKSKLNVLRGSNVDVLNELNELKRIYNQTFIINQQREIPVVKETVIESGAVAAPATPSSSTQIRKVSDFRTDEEIEEFLKSLSPAQVLSAARLSANQSMEQREITINKVMITLTKPDMDIDQAITTEIVSQIEDLKMINFTGNLVYYAFARDEARQLYHDEVTAVINKDSSKLGQISTITPSNWFTDFVETQVYTAARGKLYEQFSVKVPKEDRIENATVRTYTTDIHHVMSKFGSLLSIVPFVPDDSVASTMGETVFSDIQLLVHYAVATNPDIINYFEFLKDEYGYMSEGSKFSKVKRAVNEAVFKLLRARETHTFKLMANRSVAPVSTTDKSRTEIPANILPDLLPFIIDNKSIYDLKAYEAKSGDIINTDKATTLIRDTPIGKFLNFDRASAAEFSRLVKKIKKEQYITSDARVSVKSQGVIGSMDCVRHIYTALMTSATTLRLIFGTNFAEALERLVVRNPKFKRVQYVPTLEAYPGALFFVTLFTSRNLALGRKRFSVEEYMDRSRLDFTRLFENFINFLPSLEDVKAASYVPTLKGVYSSKNRNEISFSISKTEDMLQGLRFMEINELKKFRISNKVNIMTTQAHYLSTIMNISIQPTSGALTENVRYFYAVNEPGEVLAKKDVHNLPANYLGPDGFRTFCTLPLVYRFNTEIVSIAKEKKQEYSSAVESENSANIYSILQALQTGGSAMET